MQFQTKWKNHDPFQTNTAKKLDSVGQQIPIELTLGSNSPGI